MPRDPRREFLYLADIIDSARTVARWLVERGEQWDDDEILRNAVLRQLSVVGEAAACLSDDVRGRLPDIPWREIRGFRNIAVHAYFSLDWDVVHEVATVNLPDMAPKVLALLRTEDSEIAARFDTDDGDEADDNGPDSESGAS
ncbi:MAG: HepT-like ribonuclease domain-containing protein [Streptosporangiaceae bacterium]|jgi:uncharacterized protein with HEPN domain